MEELITKTHCSFRRQNWIQKLRIAWNQPDIRSNTSIPISLFVINWITLKRFCKLFPKLPSKMEVDVTLQLLPGLNKTKQPQLAIVWSLAEFSSSTLELYLSSCMRRRQRKRSGERLLWGSQFPESHPRSPIMFTFHFGEEICTYIQELGVASPVFCWICRSFTIKPSKGEKYPPCDIAGHLGGCHPKGAWHRSDWPSSIQSCVGDTFPLQVCTQSIICDNIFSSNAFTFQP